MSDTGNRRFVRRGRDGNGDAASRLDSQAFEERRLRASVRHTDACYSQDCARNRQGAPPSWLMSDSQGRWW